MPLKCFALSLMILLSPAYLAAADQAAEHVVMISVDGFPAYLLDDPKAPIPNVRRLARQGVAASGMRVINPSVTWPNHTALVTGEQADKHGVLANGILTRHGTGQPVTIEPKHDQADLIHVPTLFDAVHQAGMTTAAINWPCTRNSKTLDDNFPDVPDAVEYTTPRLREALRCAEIADGGSQELHQGHQFLAARSDLDRSYLPGAQQAQAEPDLAAFAECRCFAPRSWPANPRRLHGPGTCRCLHWPVSSTRLPPRDAGQDGRRHRGRSGFTLTPGAQAQCPVAAQKVS